MSQTRSAVQHKYSPQRSCVVCRVKSDKRDLTRLVYTESGIRIDPSGKMAGRGAYLCDNKSCWERAVKTTVLNKALRANLTDEDRERLRQAMPSAS